MRTAESDSSDFGSNLLPPEVLDKMEDLAEQGEMPEPFHISAIFPVAGPWGAA
jgi:hypothetical protein